MGKKSDKNYNYIKIQAVINKEIDNSITFSTLGWEWAIDSMRDRFLGRKHKRKLEMMIYPANDSTWITQEQRGYIFYLGGVTLQLLKQWGWRNIHTPYQALKVVMTDPEIMFADVYEDINGNEIVERLSLADDGGTPRHRVSEFIDNLYEYLWRYGMQPGTPDEYKKWMKWKKR